MLKGPQAEVYHQLTYDRCFEDEAWKKNKLRLQRA